MEDDDEFGDLYTDVLRPLQAQPQSIDSLPTSLGSGEGGMLYGASESKNSFVSFNKESNSSTQDRTLPRGGGFDLNLEAASSRTADRAASNFQASGGFKKGEQGKLPEKGSGGSNFIDDDDLDIAVEGLENEEEDMLGEKNATFMSREEDKRSRVERIGDSGNLMAQGVVGVVHLGTEQVIPGLSRKLENRGDSNHDDDLESDESEDDLEIVLNDNLGGVAGIERMKGLNGEDDDEGEPLVIVAGNGDFVHHLHHQQIMSNEQEWKGEEGGPGVDAEKKALGFAAKSEGGGTPVPVVVTPKSGFNNHMYHHPLHSQFKYVRPGAAPISGAAPVTSGGVQGHPRPPITVPPVAGRGRGDWRPTGIRGALPLQKGFHPNYGSPVSGSIAGRGYGSGLDFTLPSHRTIFEVDIDGFEDKPWKFPGIDVSDFFNFGLNEESWKDYCKQLEQLRLETTMQSKIRVYESSRAEQDYDPDLPPELAAAVGNNDIHSENANIAKVEASSSELTRARGWPPTPTGRPIPVETGSGDRLPSMDTRRLRLHDSDTIIEIICQTTADDEMADQDNSAPGENLVLNDTNDLQNNNNSEHSERSSPPSEVMKTDVLARRTTPDKNSASPRAVDGEVLHSDSEEALPREPESETGTTISQRSAKEKAPLKHMKINASREMQSTDHHNESLDDDNGTKNPLVSSSQVIESKAEPATVEDEANYESAAGERGPEIEREERATDPTTSDVHSDEKLMRKKRDRSQVEQVYQESDKDLNTALSAKNSKARSGSSRDNRQFGDNFEDEVLQDRHATHARGQRRQVGSEYNASTRSYREKEGSGRQNVTLKGREESISRRRGDPSISLHRPVKGENNDSRKETDASEGSWRRKESDNHPRRTVVEDTRKRVHGDEISSSGRIAARDREKTEKDENYQSRNQLEKGAWRGADYDQEKQRHWEDNLKNHNEVNDSSNNKRRKDGAYASRGEQGEKEGAVFDHKESSSRRKRERNDGFDQWKGDELAKSKDDGTHHVRKKDERSGHKERDERQKSHIERHRSKERHEENFSRKEREAAQADMRTGRPVEDKSWSSRPRGKDNYKGSGRDDGQKDIGRYGDQFKRRDRPESEKVSQNRVHEDVQSRATQGGKGEKRTRYERTRGSDDSGAVHASDIAKQQEHQKKDSRRISKEPEGGEHSSMVNSQRNHDENSGQIGETIQHHGGKKDGEKTEKEQHSLKKQGEEGSSDDDNGSKRGRSKLERWTSQKERDVGATSLLSPSMKKSSKIRDRTNNATGPPLDERPPRKLEDKPQPSANDKETKGETNSKAEVEDKKHLDTVEKLKKRSERFKLPMPGEKDTSAGIKKTESNILPSPPTENHQDSDVKPERPPRKRRWTGN